MANCLKVKIVNSLKKYVDYKGNEKWAYFYVIRWQKNGHFTFVFAPWKIDWS